MAHQLLYLINGKNLEEDTKTFNVMCQFSHYTPFYFDGKLATDFETLVKDKFDGLENINEVRSDYIRKKMKEYNVKSKYPRFDDMLDDEDEDQSVQNRLESS